MSKASLPPIELIQRPEQLRRLVAYLKRQPRIAVDTESNSLYAYAERVCLIQLSVPEVDYLIDPLALSDLSPLRPLLASSKIEKVFHAAEYDLLCLKRDFDFLVANVYDTRIACRTLGWKVTGLGDILNKEFGVSLDKRCQRANWGKRPLPAHLLDYARLDTHYLLPLRDRLEAELRQAAQLDEAAEAMAYASQTALPHRDERPTFWSVSHARELNPEQAAVLRELYGVRDRNARRLDRPPFKVMEDHTLLQIARLMPSDNQQLSSVPGMTPRQIQRYGGDVLAAVARGCSGPRPRRPKTENGDQVIQARYEALRRWRKRAAEARQIESDVVLPREMLWAIARSAPRTLDELRPMMDPLSWRHRIYGQEIISALWG
ncbi:MAG: HRDC domain-containing protein [Anaerolineales bacterium]|nr:HRDC domain-containing protein [Anaerolineales bacterium]